MTFDSEAELHKTKEVYPAAKLVIRIRVDDSKSIFQVVYILSMYCFSVTAHTFTSIE